MASPSGYSPFRPAWSSECLCGSGQKYRNCCHGRLPGFEIGERWRAHADAGRWGAAVLALRADVTQYTIWHVSHTAPTKGKAPPIYKGQSLWKIDVEALSDRVENLMFAYMRSDRGRHLHIMLDRLERNIDDPSWRAKIAYHKAMARLWHDDRIGAAIELEAAGPITPESDDVDLIQIHLDLCRNLGLSRTLAFMDRIVEITTSRTDRIQYGGARAFQLIMAGDQDGGVQALKNVVERARKAESEKPLGSRAEIFLCMALEGIAVFTREQPLFAEIIERLTPLFDGDQLTPAGRAMIGRSIGDACRYAGNYDAAIESYGAAFMVAPIEILRVFEAECRLRLGNVDEALNMLRRTNVAALDAPEMADYAFTYFYVALRRKDREALETARDLLRNCVTPQPYFEQLRLSHIVTIQDALAALDQQRELPKPKGLSDFLRSASRYVQLQPNVAGMGINLNNILNDLADRLDEKPEPSPHDRIGDATA